MADGSPSHKHAPTTASIPCGDGCPPCTTSTIPTEEEKVKILYSFLLPGLAVGQTTEPTEHERSLKAKGTKLRFSLIIGLN